MKHSTHNRDLLSGICLTCNNTGTMIAGEYFYKNAAGEYVWSLPFEQPCIFGCKTIEKDSRPASGLTHVPRRGKPSDICMPEAAGSTYDPNQRALI